MPLTIDLQEDHIAEICRRYQVRKLELFGSAAGAGFDPLRSDIDVLVEFGEIAQGSYADAWFGLRESLENLFGRPVDMVSTASVRNPYFLASLNRSRRTLYAA